MENATDEIVKLEKQYWQALVDQDFDKALDLTADLSIVAGPQGVTELTHEKFKEMMGQGPKWKVEAFDFSDVAVQQITDDVAIIGYKVRSDMTVEGKRMSMDLADTSTWVKKNGKWACALHSEAIAGDPFGRDKASKGDLAFT